ncbi:sensor histidine kinase [Streptomyces sp. NPDC007063]|uniref:sensor histidine kinase n=1 Tax=Streptomyces sp. NPDC007063 TaxID=3364772 RepID=UPI0036737DD2
MGLLGIERDERPPAVGRLLHRGSEPARRAARRIRRPPRHREEGRAASRTRRGVRDRAVDTGAFLFAGCFLVLTADSVVIDPGTSETALFLDQLTGALACAALFLRRRQPVVLAVGLLLLEPFSHFVTGPILVALFTVAVDKPPRVTGYLACMTFAPVPFLLAIGPAPDDPRTASAATYFALVAGSIGWGLYVRSRRQLLVSLRERAARAAAESRREAREDIAREMHDVLGHRLSLLSVHAGALEFNPGAGPQEIGQAAAVIRDSAHRALEDLRDVIGVLRAPEDGNRPQPVLADIGNLADEARRAGATVALDVAVAGGPDPAPAVAGRTAYRIVQEGLTNARKHGAHPTAPVSVTVRGASGAGLTVEVRNPVRHDGATRDRAGPRLPGAGQGLIGLAERTLLAGGTLEHGKDGADYRLYAALPWPG